MPPKKILKPGTVVYDLDLNEYVVFKADSADHPNQSFVFNPRCGETYLTRTRALTRKERGES